MSKWTKSSNIDARLALPNNFLGDLPASEAKNRVRFDRTHTAPDRKSCFFTLYNSPEPEWAGLKS